MPKGIPSVERTSLPGNTGWAEASALLRKQVASGDAPDFETRLDLARLLLSAGRRDEAHEALLNLASEAERAGQTARAVAVLRRMAAAWPGSGDVERRLADIARQRPGLAAQAPTREAALPLPPLRRPEERTPEASVDPEPPSALAESLSGIESLFDEPALADVSPLDVAPGSPAPVAGRGEPADETAPDDFLDLAIEILRLTPAASAQTAAASPKGIFASPLFYGLSEQEVLAILRRLRVADYEAGDILVTEGEEGQTVFVVCSGRVNVFVRSPTGRDVLVALLGEGDFFGEVSAISGSRRTATIAAATPCGLLELSKTDVDLIARAHPRVKNALDSAFVQRAGNLTAAVARTIDLTAQGHVREYADVALAARFGQSRWSPRVRLRLCHALIQAGHEEAVVPILAELATGLVRAGRSDKAEVLLRRIERVVSPEVQEICLSPLKRMASSSAEESRRGSSAERSDTLGAEGSGFRPWLDQMARERARRAHEAGSPSDGEVIQKRLAESYGPGFEICPLFEGLSPEDLADLVGELRVLRVDAGDVVLTEGESGQSLFVLLGGSVKVWARDTRGRNRLICRLDEGAFFGEVATLSGRLRCASVTAAEPCVLLELTREDVDSIRTRLPHVGEILDDHLARRSAGSAAEA